MGSVDARAAKAAQKRKLRPSIALALGLVSVGAPLCLAADLHTNAVFNVNFSLPGQAQNQTSLKAIPAFTLSTLWTNAPSNDNGSLITVDGANQRTIGYSSLSNHLYLASRSSSVESNYTVSVLDASAGTVLYTLNTTGLYNSGAVGEGGIGLASIAVADDGAIYACNMSVDACGCDPNAVNSEDSLFRIYRWADENSVPLQIFSGDPSDQATPLRWGDTLAVQGSGINTQILLDSADGTHLALLAPSDASLTVFTNVSFANAGADLPNLGRSLEFAGTNTFFRKAKGSSLQAATWNTTKHTFSITASSRLPATVGPVALGVLGQMAAIDFNGDATTGDNLKLYDLSNFVAPALQDQASFPTNQQSNPEYRGQVLFSGFNIWGLDANNGLGAWEVNGPHLITFYTAQAGHIGNAEIIRALATSLGSNNLSGAKLMLKMLSIGTDHSSSRFVLRKGSSEIDVSTYMPQLTKGTTVVAQSSKPPGTVTNETDYAITGFRCTASGVTFDVQGLGIWKSASIVSHGQALIGQPIPNSITVSSLDGVGSSGSQTMSFHGSATITGRKLEVIANQPPTASLLDPQDGKVFSSPASITLFAQAADKDGSVSLVEFFQDGNKLGDNVSGSGFFQFTWTNAPAGTFRLYVKATDDDGVSTFSTTNTVTINPAP